MKKTLSIITVVKNDEKNIQKTIRSIVDQKKMEYEYIIIEGRSSDKTLEKILKYKKKIDKIISQKDKGIYHAMNKGIKLANGEIIVFCNSGDFFYKNSLTKVMDLFNKFNYDFVFGTVVRNYTKSKILKYGFNFKKIIYNFDFATSHTTGFFHLMSYDTRFPECVVSQSHKSLVSGSLYTSTVDENRYSGRTTTTL